MPLWEPKHSWTEELIHGLQSYIAFWQIRLGEMRAGGQQLNYLSTLGCFMERLKINWKGLTDEWKQKKCAEKAREDRAKFSKMPQKEKMNKAVRRAFCMVRKVHKKYKGSGLQIPDRVWTRLNDEVSGAIAYGTFAGRRGEWEKMLLRTMMKVLEEGKDHVVCPDHKTSSTYGDLAKWLSPRLIEMFKLCLLYTSPSPRDGLLSRMPSSA